MPKSIMTKQKFINQWIRHFAKEVSKNDISLYVKDQYIWHIFSWNLLNSDAFLVGDAARQAYDEVDKSNCIFCDMFGPNGVSERMLEEYISSKTIKSGDKHFITISVAVTFGAPYITEYPLEIIEGKVKLLTDRLEDTFETKMLVHRSGRWATDERYFKVLDENNYKIDCSVTPMVNWSNAPGQSPDSWGNDYTYYKRTPYFIDNTRILEIPVSIRENHRLKSLKGCGIRKGIKRIYEAQRGYGPLWLRPRNYKDNLDDMIYLADLILKEKSTDYLMFMLHSSEFMPGGSPSFPDKESIEILYKNLGILFNHVSKNYLGDTFKEYYENTI